MLSLYIVIFCYLKINGDIIMNEQLFWSISLLICWVIVSYGQFHQGKIIKQKHNNKNVSIRLPLAVFIAQLILFVKGIYYNDWSLIAGCIIVNIGTVYNIVQIRKFHLKRSIT